IPIWPQPMSDARVAELVRARGYEPTPAWIARMREIEGISAPDAAQEDQRRMRLRKTKHRRLGKTQEPVPAREGKPQDPDSRTGPGALFAEAGRRVEND